MEAPPARLGPLVRRSVHHGALLWFVGMLQFLIVMSAVGSELSSYSLTQNRISDLGNTGGGLWAAAFNGSAIALGLLLLLGAILIKSAFPDRRTSQIGLGLVVVAGLGTALAGIFPENSYQTGHDVGAAMALLGGGLALLVLSVAMLRDTRWTGYRAYTMLSGLVSVVAFALYVSGHFFALGPGGMERLTAAPLYLWILLASIHLLYVPAFAPKAIPGG